jgi:DNA-binding winged helix-turn-helix (wHTH) protein
VDFQGVTGLQKLFTVGEWRVQPRHNQISTSNQEIRIEPKAMRVLVCLAEHPGEVVSKEQLIEKVWEGAFVTDEALTYSIWGLRKAFGDNAKKPRFIQTIPKKGYCLIAPVSFPETEPKKRVLGPRRWAWVSAAAVAVLVAPRRGGLTFRGTRER